MKSVSLLSIASLTESLLWYGYCLLLIGLSFLPFRYESSAWLQFASLYYLFCAIYLITLLAGAKFNLRAIYVAKIPILLSLFILIWLLAQLLLPVSGDLYKQIFISSATPDWYDHKATLSLNPQATKQYFLSQVFIISWMLLTLSLITNRKRVTQLLFTITLIGLAHALIGIYAKLDNLILVDRQSLDGHFNVARGIFVNRNHYASFICVTLIGAITYFINSLIQEQYQQKRILALLDIVLSPKIVYLLALIIGLIALLFSQSRAALFGFLFAFCAVVLVIKCFDKRVKSKWGVLLAALIFVFGIIYFFGQELMLRLSTQGFSIGERLEQWKITWLAIKDAPILGYGAGSYSTVFQIYREHEPLRHVVFDQSHNEYLHLWLEQGIVGLVLFLGLVVVLFIKLFMAYQRSSSKLNSALAISGMVVISSVLAQAFVDFNLQILNIRCFFFVIIGLVFASMSLQSNFYNKKIP